jgi:hypothetical protein
LKLRQERGCVRSTNRSSPAARLSQTCDLLRLVLQTQPRSTKSGLFPARGGEQYAAPAMAVIEK